MRQHKRPKRKEFLTEEEILEIFFYDFEAEFSKNYATEFDKRLKYVLEVPEILEKAWKMPWKESWKGEPKPVLTIYGDNLDILDVNEKTWEYNDAGDTIVEFFKQAFMKQLEGF